MTKLTVGTEAPQQVDLQDLLRQSDAYSASLHPVGGRKPLGDQGRDTMPGETAEPLARGEPVLKAWGELGVWLRQAYRDTDAAWERPGASREAEGGPKVAERAVGYDGAELRGKAGCLPPEPPALPRGSINDALRMRPRGLW